MSYKPLRKDLTEDHELCEFCKKPLRSMKAFILKHERDNRIVFSGPTCAQRAISQNYTLKGLPDLTKFTQSDETSSSGRGNGVGINSAQDPQRAAHEYLELREGKLASSFKCSFHILRQYYEKLEREPLTDDEINHINNIERRAPAELKRSTLQRCYNYLFWLDAAIAKLPEEKKSYLSWKRKHLIANKTLSKDELIKVNNWFRNIHGIPQLK